MSRLSSCCLRAVVSVHVASALSCHSMAAGPVEPQTAPVPGRSAERTGEQRDLVPGPYEGPRVALSLDAGADRPQAAVRVTFPTGGWELRVDSSSTKQGRAVARLTLVRPAKEEMVTQALVQRSWQWPIKEPVTSAEVWVNIERRGDPPRPPEYRLAARHPDKPLSKDR